MRLAARDDARLAQQHQLHSRHLVLESVGEPFRKLRVGGDDVQAQQLGGVLRLAKLVELDPGLGHQSQARRRTRPDQGGVGRIPRRVAVARGVAGVGGGVIAVALVEDPRRFEQHHLGVDVRVRQDVAWVEGDVVDGPQVVDGELERPGLPDHDLRDRLLDLRGDHLAQPLGVDGAGGHQDPAQRPVLERFVLGEDGGVQDAPVDHPRGDQQVAQLRGARRLGRNQPAAVEADHRPLAGPREQQRARPPAEVNELHHVGDGDVFEAAGDTHGLAVDGFDGRFRPFF